MSETAQPQSRLAKIKDQAAKGELGKTAITLTGRKIVSIDKLVEDPENDRKTFDDMDDLVASITAHGVVEPPTVIQLANDQYQIVTGHRRFRAAKLAGLTQIEVLIRDPEEKWERRKKSLISNVQRADIRAIELAESLKLLLANDPKIKTQEDLAQAIGKSKVWVSKVLRILDLPEPLKAKVSTSKLLIPHDALSEIARLTDTQKQAELVGALVNGATMRDIRTEISVHKGKAPAPKEGTATPKPKWVFHTEHGADIIIQAKKSSLSLDERIAALQEALKQAKAERS
jgi:ParB family chromosome partitioning protein